MADVFEEMRELAPWRRRLWTLIEETPWLQWQLLTKRPENVSAMVPWRDAWPQNVWIGTSIENARFTFRAEILRALPAAVSAEPLLGSLVHQKVSRRGSRRPLDLAGIHWLIAGGESGPRARPTETEWLRELRDASRESGVAFFLKQLGGSRDKRGGSKAVLDGRRWTDLPAAPIPAAG
jgi:protein gp37